MVGIIYDIDGANARESVILSRPGMYALDSNSLVTATTNPANGDVTFEGPDDTYSGVDLSPGLAVYFNYYNSSIFEVKMRGELLAASANTNLTSILFNVCGINGLFEGNTASNTPSQVNGGSAPSGPGTYAVYTINDGIDTDADGTPDNLDIDSDNDGLPDNIEAQPTVGYVAPGTGDADSDGLLDAYDTVVDADPVNDPQNNTGLDILDTDGDNAPDYVDTDTDNDGKTDTEEAGLTTATSTVDTDGDGLLDDYDATDNTGGLYDSNDDQNNGAADTNNDDDISTVEVDFREDVILDQDEDGVPDSVDLDDDNDGIFDSVECPTFPIDFTGAPSYTSPQFFGDATIAIARVDGLNGTAATNGNAAGDIRLGESSSTVGTYLDGDQVTFTVNTGQAKFLLSGSTATIAGFSGPNGDQIYIDAAGGFIVDDPDGQIVVVSQTANTIVFEPTAIIAAGAGTWQISTVEFVTSFIVQADGDPATAFNIKTMPFTDTDGDGIQDCLDLDSDNDGITDVIESANGSLDTDGNGQVDGDVGANGMPDAAETAIDSGMALTAIPNSDTDGLADYLDIDSDDDGIPDNVEAQATTGYIAPSGTGTGITDANDNGLDDNYETAQGGTNILPVNTDQDSILGDTTPDYLDTDSDGDSLSDTAEAGVGTYVGTDTDNDGLDDGFEGVNNNDGPDVNDELNGGSANTTNTDATSPDVDYRDANDKDNDGIADAIDIDDDNDGILDVEENGGIDPFADTDTDGVPNYLDTDAPGFVDVNGDGVDDNFDFDGDGVINQFDLDADGDGIPDVVELGSGALDLDGDGTVDGDVGLNGYVDSIETAIDNGIPVTTPPNSDSNAGDEADYLDIDADDDGIPDNIEAQSTSNYAPPTGVDSDGDGLDDQYDIDGIPLSTPLNSPENTDTSAPAGDAIPDYLDTDSDADGINDAFENGDVDNVPLGTDADGDGLDDAFDDNDDATIAGATVNDGINPPNAANLGDEDTDLATGGDVDFRDVQDNDNDGIPDNVDLDDDNDGIPDITENGGTDPFADSDGDGILDYLDTDAPGFVDANSDGVDDNFDFDQDGIINQFDLDADNDGIPDAIEAGGVDADGDGIHDGFVDNDLDGLNDLLDDVDNGAVLGEVTTGTPLTVPNSDSNAGDQADYLDIDADDDGIPDNVEAQPTAGYVAPLGTDADNDGIDDAYDVDIPGNTLLNTPENTDSAATGGDTIPDYLDTDSDADGANDVVEAGVGMLTNVDTDGDGLDDGFEGATVNDVNDVNDELDNGSLDTTETNPSTPDVDYRDLADNDNDGIPDATDLDDDNDGILDTNEIVCASSLLLDYSNAPNDNFNLSGQTLASEILGVTLDHAITGNFQLWHARGINAGDTFNLFRTGNNALDPAVITYNFVGGDIVNLEYSIRDSDNISGGSEAFKVEAFLDGVLVSPSEIIFGPNMRTSSYGANFYEGTTNNTATFSYDNSARYKYDNILVDELRVTIVHTNGAASQGTLHQFEAGCLATDSDNDSTPDYLDPDSDNDGCPDAVEAGIINSGDEIANGSITDNPAQVDGDGVPNVASGGQPTMSVVTSVFENACEDTDMDGVPDATDLDDDNDGILDTLETVCTDTPFNTTDVANIPQIQINGYNVNTTVASSNITLVGAGDNAGNIRFGEDDVSPTTYTLTFDQAVTFVLGSKTVTGGGFFEAGEEWNISSPDASFLVSDPNGNLNVADGASASNSFDFAGVNASGTNPFGDPWTITSSPTKTITISYNNPTFVNNGGSINISIACIIPDSDGDGIPNLLDTDSDNDNCPDAVEAGIIANGDEIANGSITDLSTQVDSNGVPNVASGGQPTTSAVTNAVQNACEDTDMDGVPDFSDLDDDNDGIFDTNECVDSDLAGLIRDSSTPIANQMFKAFGIISLEILTDNFTVDQGVGNTAEIGGGANTTALVSYKFNKAIASLILDVTDIDNGLESIATFIAQPSGIAIVPVVSGDLDFDGTTITSLIADGSGSIVFSSIPNGTREISYQFTRVATGENSFVSNVSIGVDSDSDGLADCFDGDSDNDGCPDAVESGVAATNVDFSTGQVNGGVDPLTGIPLSEGAGNPTNSDVTQVGPDSDFDGISNACDPVDSRGDLDDDGVDNTTDLDDDNDGILDVEECGPNFNGLGFVPVGYEVTLATQGFGLAGLTTGGSYTFEMTPDGGATTFDLRATITNTNTTVTIFAQGDDPTIFNESFGRTTVLWEAFVTGTSTPFPISFEINIADLDGGPASGGRNETILPVKGDLIGWAANNPSDIRLLDDGFELNFQGTTNGVDSQQAMKMYYNQISSYTISYSNSQNTVGDPTVDPAAYIHDMDNDFVFANPAPCNIDVDGDGIPNSVDLDADNDGIWDVIEGGGADGEPDGEADGVIDPLTGIPATAGSGLAFPNTDGLLDGGDPFDQDSDEDGCSDANEAFNDANCRWR